ncbi:MAG: response regulator [Geminicoccaceae bacterium]
MTDEQHVEPELADLSRDALECRVRELTQACDEAEAKARTKTVFMATMSHEIREPMNGVIGMSRLLQETSLDAMQREYLDIVLNSSEALLTIINDILDLSKLDVGSLVLAESPFRLESVVRRVWSRFETEAAAKSLTFEITLDSDLPETVGGDPGRLRQILINLISNAIKFTDRGSVALRIDKNPLLPDQIRFEVRDTGIGIAAEILPQLFSPFAQGDPSVARTYGGNGLGLMLSRSLAHAMGGKLMVTSAVGEGTCFTLSLPLRTVARNQTLPDDVDLRDVDALVIDRDAGLRERMADMLTAWRIPCYLAATGNEGLAWLEQRRTSDRTIICFVDQAPPDMKMPALTQALERLGCLERMKLVMLASSGLRGDAERARRQGFAAYLPKPVESSTLLSCVRQVTRKASEDFVTIHSMSETSPSPLAVLVADDNPVNRRLASLVLERAGHKVSAANDGQEAVEAVKAGGIDIVLMDIQMPIMDGFAATAAIRGLPDAKAAVPIVAVTANAMRGDQERCQEVGMNAYLSKPIDRAKLLATVERCTLPAARASV